MTVNSPNILRLTSIDIGTNTILMLIADINITTKKITTIHDIQRVPRLGKGVDSNRNIKTESIDKAIEILNEYKNISNENGSEKIYATATSFIRDSNNKDDFILQIKYATDIDIRILSGKDEAYLTYIGTISDKQNRINKDSMYYTIDIGGGSTEISYSSNISNQFQNIEVEGTSLNIGSVRIKERFLHHSPPLKDEIEKAVNFIHENLNQLEVNTYYNSSLIGIAGTITTLGACKLNLKSFDRHKVDGLVLTIEDINDLLAYFFRTPMDLLFKSADYMEGRADIIIPGTLILKCFMERYNFDRLIISNKGLRYGVLINEIIRQY